MHCLGFQHQMKELHPKLDLWFFAQGQPSLVTSGAQDLWLWMPFPIQIHHTAGEFTAPCWMECWVVWPAAALSFCWRVQSPPLLWKCVHFHFICVTPFSHVKNSVVTQCLKKFKSFQSLPCWHHSDITKTAKKENLF
jgi:hypothetical protein